MKVIVEKIEDVIIDENFHGGGYCDGKCIYVSSDLTPLQGRFVAYHEVLHHYCKGRVRHGLIDKMVQELIDTDGQLNFNCPDNKEL